MIEIMPTAILAITAIICIFKVCNTYVAYLINESTLTKWKGEANAMQERFEERIREQEREIADLRGGIDALLMQVNVRIDG